MKTALISGITGQDGAYLAELLLDKGYRVVGIVRRSSSRNVNTERTDWLGITGDVEFVDGDLLDTGGLARTMRSVRPDEIYNLAAQSFVQTSWAQPVLTSTVTGLGAVNMLEAARLEAADARFYQASSSEMFGVSSEPMQNEQTRFHPRSPYAAAKVFAHWMAINYRESYGMPVCAGILFNHESPLRGLEFVTRKVTDGAARIALGLASELPIGNLDACRDWGHARDYVRAMWMMLQHDEPREFVIATGRTTSVRDMLAMAFSHLGLDWQDHVRIDEGLKRPADVDVLCGDPARARADLGWEPQIPLEAMIAEMVDADVARLRHRARVDA